MLLQSILRFKVSGFRAVGLKGFGVWGLGFGASG